VILVVAVNPALDVTHHVDSVDWSGVNRPSAVRASAGGKGLNVARVLRALGADVLLVGLAGGTAGNAVRSALSAADVPAVFAETTGETRRTFAVVDTGRGETAIFNEPGPLVSAAEFADMTALYAEALSRSSAVVLSGSLASGLPASSYADLIAMATDAGVPVLLDTSGEALLAGVAARPAIVKPNLAELDAAVGRGLPPAAGRPGRVATAAAAAAGLRDRGADAVVVTLGADGMLAVTADGSWVATTTPVSGNPTGAGDAVAAALARGLVLGSPWPDRLAEAAALGAAAVAAPVAGEFCPADYDRALAGVQVSSWEQL
jgi:tagatose 6-phosphate kinase